MIIVGISGKKRGGKNTAANYIIGQVLWLNYLVDSYSIDSKGQLNISGLMGEDNHGILDLAARHSPETQTFLEKEIYPHIKLYSCADALKQKVCIEILGLTWAQCYDEEEKNTETHLKWEDMPGVITDKEWWYQNCVDGDLSETHNLTLVNIEGVTPYMTGREVMQYVGTDMFRRMYGDVWIDSTLRQIEKDSPELAIISDIRFPNEVLGVKRNNGVVLRLTRSPHTEDQHDSEVALDPEVFDWEHFDMIVHNENMTIPDQNLAVQTAMSELGILPSIEIIQSLNENTQSK